ncbi:MAG: hypothetical protein AB8B82_17105 [Roseovarius sp.]
MKLTAKNMLETCASIPPIKPQNLLPIVIMLGIWVVLRTNGIAENAAFVVSVVTAQAYLVWRNLPVAAANLNTVQGPKSRMLSALVGVTFLVALLQLWLGSPLFTQRVLTVLCVFFLVVMVLGILNEREVMDRMKAAMPTHGEFTPPVSLLRVNAMMAALIIAMNEWLIFYESPAVWITVMPVFMLALHGVYWVMVLSTIPTQKGEPA